MMMPKRFTNNLKWQGNLLEITPGKDGNNRPVENYEVVRKIFYADIGITAQEKYLSQQAKTEVVRRIKIRWDSNITEKDYAIEIADVKYRITRIYTDMGSREMELSLAYVD